jgi:hypothetical protein
MYLYLNLNASSVMAVKDLGIYENCFIPRDAGGQPYCSA